MSYYYRPYKKDDKAKKVFKILGPCLLVPGIILCVLGVLGFVGVLGLAVGIVCIDFGFMLFLTGLIFTIMGWSKMAVYSRHSGHFEEIASAINVEPPAVSVNLGNLTVNCQNCGTLNGSDSSFCKKCGKPLNPTKTCPNCKAKISPDSQYCNQCGRPLFDNGATIEDLDNKHTGGEAADFAKAKELYNRGDYAEAFRLFKILAEQGDAEGQNGLGACYDNGQGVSQNSYQAVIWFEKAAKQGYAKAQYNLGVCYLNGRGVPSNIKEAVIWFKKAAQQGLPEAKSVLQKLGINKNDEALGNMNQAVENMNRAVSQLQEIDLAPASEVEKLIRSGKQNAETLYDLGCRYFNGTGVDMDRTVAFRCFLKAAEQGHRLAMSKLGDCYYFGYGVERDFLQSNLWYRKSKGAE